MQTTQSPLFSTLSETISKLNTSEVSEDRQQVLAPLVAFIQKKFDHGQAINLNFICTHNSRRSHLSQIWAQALAYHWNIPQVYCYSGGTEATALFPMAAEALKQSGFKIQKLSTHENPVYAIKFADNTAPVIGFSKTYDDPFNPGSEFCAIMTCSQADGGCPFIGGAELRVPVTYEDPKAFDNTPLQAEKYLERSLEIAIELQYVFSQIQR